MIAQIALSLEVPWGQGHVYYSVSSMFNETRSGKFEYHIYIGALCKASFMRMLHTEALPTNEFNMETFDIRH